MKTLNSLEENAIDSLTETLSFLDRSKKEPQKIRIAIILLDNFIELFLKSYIAKKHKFLIFEKPSEKTPKTLSLEQTINLLEKLEFIFSNNLKNQLKLLRDIRNKLNHSHVEYSQEEWREKIGEILYYVIEFENTNDLIFNVKDYVSPGIWSEIINLKEIFELHLNNAIQEATYSVNHEQDSLDDVECPECCNVRTIKSDNYISADCLYCRTVFEIEQCGQCGTWLNSDSVDNGCCNNCWEYLIEKN